MPLHQPTGRVALGLALAATTMVLWGVLPLVLKLVLGSLDAITITWFRFGVSAAVLALWLGARRGLPRLGRLSRTGWLLLAAATAGLAANYLAYLVGLDLTTPANAQVLIQMAPLLLALGGIVVFGERFTRGQWFGFAVLLAGLALFFASQLRELAAGADRYLRGVGVIAVAAVTWAGYGLAQKQLLRSLSSQEIMLCIYVGCFLCFTPGSRPDALASLDAVAAGALVFCAANTLVAYGAFAAALDHWEASRVSAILSLTPLATLAFASLALRATPQWIAAERVPAAGVAGALAVVAGSLLVSLGGRDAVRRAGRS
jgi:drug/metabolite transporter (DMT)-like permease